MNKRKPPDKPTNNEKKEDSLRLRLKKSSFLVIISVVVHRPCHTRITPTSTTLLARQSAALLIHESLRSLSRKVGADICSSGLSTAIPS